MAIRFLSNQTIDSTLDLTGRVKVSGNNTDQYFYEGARTGVGVTFSLYDNANNVYFNGYSGIVLRANQIGGSGGSIILSGGNVGIGLVPASSVVLDVKEPDASNDLILGLTAGTGSRAQIRSVVQTSTESALSFHTTLSSSTQERFRILNTGAFSLGNSGTNYGTAGQVLTSNGNSAPYWSTPTSGTITGSGTSGRLAKFTGTSSIGDSGIIDSSNAVAITINGNEEVGIGTTTPFYKLDVNGTFRTTGNATFAGDINIENATPSLKLTDTNGGYTEFAANNTDLVIKVDPDDVVGSSTIQFEIDGSEYMRIATNGRVGIGTSSPDNKLDVVVSDVNITPNSESSAVFRRNGNNYLTILTGSTSQGGILFGNASDNNDGTISYTHSSQTMAFSTADTERMRIDSSGTTSIVKTSAGSSTIPLVVRNSGSANVGTEARLFLSTVANDDRGAYISSIITSSSNDNALILATNSAGSTPTERMRIRSSGTVGIGAEGFDSQMLTIAAGTLDGAIYATSTDANCFASFRDNSSTANIEFGAIGNDHVFRKDATEYMRIDSSGNVGINVTSPSAGLQIALGGTTIPSAGSNTGSVCFGNTTSDNAYGLVMGANSNGVGYISSQRTDGTATTYNLAIQPNGGNVGIGTSSPSGLTHFYGNGSSTYIINQKNSTKWSEWHVGGTHHYLLWDSTADLRFGTETSLNGGGASEKMRITSGGRVGIGTTNPSARLQVNFDGDNGSGGLVEYGIAHSSSINGQATIGSWNTGDGYANLNLASSNGTYFWHLSKRPSSASHRLEYFFYESGFYSRFIFTKLGDFHADGDIVAYSTTASDEKLKNNIEPIHNALDKVSKLNGVSFTWNCGSRKDEKDLGVIAQNVEKVLPELVREKESPYHDDQIIKTVDYEKLTAVLIEAVKELQQKVEKLENKKCCCK